MKYDDPKNHVGHCLEVVETEGYAYVECTECGIAVQHLYGDKNPNDWEIGLRVIVDLHQDFDGTRKGDLQVLIRGEAFPYEMVSIERRDGREFVCMKCMTKRPASQGAADNMPFVCDRCWEPPKCEFCGAGADTPDHLHAHDCSRYRPIEDEITHRGELYRRVEA